MMLQISQENFLQKDGRLWMTADDLGSKLGFTDGGKGISKLYNRNKEDFEPFKGVVNLGTPGGEQSFLCFDEQGCYIAAMLARTDQAKQFRRALARFIADLRRDQEGMIAEYARMRRLAAQAWVEAFCARQGMKPRDIERIRELRPHLSAAELGRLYNVSNSTMEKLLRRIRHASGDFADRRPPQLKQLGGAHE